MKQKYQGSGNKHSYVQLIFDKGAKAIQWGEKYSLFNKWHCAIGYLHDL